MLKKPAARGNTAVRARGLAPGNPELMEERARRRRSQARAPMKNNFKRRTRPDGAASIPRIDYKEPDSLATLDAEKVP